MANEDLSSRTLQEDRAVYPVYRPAAKQSTTTRRRRNETFHVHDN